MHKLIKLLFLSCSIIAVANGYAAPSSEEDDGRSLKRSIAKENQSAKRLQTSDDANDAQELKIDAPQAVEVAPQIVDITNILLNHDPLYSSAIVVLQILRGADPEIGKLSTKEQNALSLTNKHNHRLVLSYRMVNDPRQLHLNPWVLLPGWSETDLYRLNAAVFHGAKALMHNQICVDTEGYGERINISHVRAARKFISSTFGGNGVLGSIRDFFIAAEQQLIESEKQLFNQDLPFPQEIADSATPDHKSEFNLTSLHRYITEVYNHYNPRNNYNDYNEYKMGWLNKDPEIDPYRMSLPKRFAYVSELQTKMLDNHTYTIQERGEFAKNVNDLIICDLDNGELDSLVSILWEAGEYTLAAARMNQLFEENGIEEDEEGVQDYSYGMYTTNEWAYLNLQAGNYQKVAEIFEFEIANGRSQYLDLDDYNGLITSYQKLNQQDKVEETRQLAAQHNIDID